MRSMTVCRNYQDLTSQKPHLIIVDYASLFTDAV